MSFEMGVQHYWQTFNNLCTFVKILFARLHPEKAGSQERQLLDVARKYQDKTGCQETQPVDVARQDPQKT